jgi:hypothetical protein
LRQMGQFIESNALLHKDDNGACAKSTAMERALVLEYCNSNKRTRMTHVAINMVPFHGVKKGQSAYSWNRHLRQHGIRGKVIEIRSVQELQLNASYF